MAKTVTGTEQDEPEEESRPDPWEEAKPKMKAIFREAFEEWLGEQDVKEEKDDDGDNGRAPGAAAPGRRATDERPARAKRQAQPSGGSILDVLLGH